MSKKQEIIQWAINGIDDALQKKVSYSARLAEVKDFLSSVWEIAVKATEEERVGQFEVRTPGEQTPLNVLAKQRRRISIFSVGDRLPPGATYLCTRQVLSGSEVHYYEVDEE